MQCVAVIIPVAGHWQNLSHNVVHLALIKIQTHNIGSCKSNYLVPSPDQWLFSTYCSRGTSESSTYGKQRICLSNSWSAHFHVSRARCTTLCDKFCQWPATGQWLSSSPPVSSTNKTDIIEILLKVALNTIWQAMWPRRFTFTQLARKSFQNLSIKS
jgi:hypothetical protein